MDAKPKVGVNRGNAGKGRPPGSPNKSTKAFRDTITKMLDDNKDNVAIWLAKVAETDPAKALDLLAKLAEYAAPKLSRTEHTGEEGGPVQMQIGWID